VSLNVDVIIYMILTWTIDIVTDVAPVCGLVMWVNVEKEYLQFKKWYKNDEGGIIY